MEEKSSNIYWNKIKETRKEVQEAIKLFCEVILYQYELQDIKPDKNILKKPSFLLVNSISLKSLEDIVDDIEDAKKFISKINSLSNVCIIDFIENKLKGKDSIYHYSDTKFLISLRHPELLKEIISYINKNTTSLLKDKNTNSHNFKTEIKKETGYIILGDSKIPIGEYSSGKFKLLETLGGENFGIAKSLDLVFKNTQNNKDKNKMDGTLNSEYLKDRRQIYLIKSQVKEINRAINEYAERNKNKNLNFRITVKSEGGKVWLKEREGRRG